MIRAIIVDNEKPAIQILKLFLEKKKNIDVIGSFLNAPEALNNLSVLDPDVVFLDIDMPEMNGLEMAEIILNNDFNIEAIFVTAYSQYALDAFRVNAIDYLLKPILYEDIEQTVKRLLKRIKSRIEPTTYPKVTKTKIYFFGRLLVYGYSDDVPVKWRTSKAEELFAFLYHKKDNGVPKSDICDALWPDIPEDKVDVYLHTSVYKMKKDLHSFHIPIDVKFSNGCYFMHLPETYCDVDEFDSIVESDIVIDKTNLNKYVHAIDLYKNHYLETNGYLWSLPQRESYSLKYHTIIKALVNYYVKEKNTIAIENIIKPLLEKLPLDEYAHETLLKVYYVKKDHASFITHYNTMIDLYQNELGIKPKQSIEALYKSIIKNI
jgi:two-component SAPR family response regulator